jgi:hypothetical protein
VALSARTHREHHLLTVRYPRGGDLRRLNTVTASFFRAERVRRPCVSSLAETAARQTGSTVFAFEKNGQRLCVDVTAITTLGRGRSSNPVQPKDRVKHAKAGKSAHVEEQEKNLRAKTSPRAPTCLISQPLGTHTRAEAWSQRSTTWWIAKSAPPRAQTANAIVSYGALPAENRVSHVRCSQILLPAENRSRRPYMNGGDDHPSFHTGHLPSHVL